MVEDQCHDKILVVSHKRVKPLSHRGSAQHPQAVLLPPGPNIPFLQVPSVPRRSHRHPRPDPTFRFLSPPKPAPLLRDRVLPERFASGASFTSPAPTEARRQHPGKAAHCGGSARLPPAGSGGAPQGAQKPPGGGPPPAGAISACGAGGSAGPGPRGGSRERAAPGSVRREAWASGGASLGRPPRSPS